MQDRKIIRPSDCMIGFSIPHSRKSFYKNQRSSHPIDFTNQVVWPCYEKDTVKPAVPLFKDYIKLGVKVKYEYTFFDFGQFFNSNHQQKLLILFAHWKQNQIEFFDGLADIEDVKNIIPFNNDLVIDLNVCKCDNFKKILETQHHHLTFRTNRNRYCYPIFWLRYYRFFFHYINYNAVTYNEASEYCIPTFFNYIKDENN